MNVNNIEIRDIAQIADEQKAKRIISDARNKTIEYPCGCVYLFDHYIILERICPKHEADILTYHS
jgi:hypothetical protein